MPPKARISKDMIVNAAFEIARESGVDAITARTVASRLNCSTQPVMYQFATIGELRKVVYQKADQFHSEYIRAGQGDYDDAFLEIGMRYIHFASEEKNLFKLLFQTDAFGDASMGQLVESPEISDLLNMIISMADIELDQARVLFTALFLEVHGYASMLANNAMSLDEAQAQHILKATFDGVLSTVKRGELWE